MNDLQEMAGAESALARKHQVHLHYVPVNSIPEDYAVRLVEMFPGRFKNLHLYMPDPYDLILSSWRETAPKTATMWNIWRGHSISMLNCYANDMKRNCGQS